ncbi:MAG: M20/M25/M40 family metallo-hydrolase [Anaerolineae bacterium]|nr:M20/M25/M40 family metallo-hydrolase [Anaerolineae bacterium]
MPDLPDYRPLAARYAEPLTRFLADLVRIRSVNGADPEAAVAERIIAEAERLGFAARLITKDPARPNALVEWGSGERGFAIIAHIDTVAEGDHTAWKHGPFSAEIDGGRMYGRGAADNKAGVACGLYTLALLRDHGLLDPVRVRVVVAGVVDEESGASSTLGVRYLLDQGCLPVQGAIYAYASDIVCIGHRGLLRLILRAQGQAIHSGSPEWSRGQGGVNAVTGLAEALLRLEALHVPAPEHPAFVGLGCRITPGTVFHGGQFESMVPASAEALVDVRLMPGQSADDVLTQVDAILAEVMAGRPGLSLDYAIKNNLPAAAIPADHPLAETAGRYARAYTGAPWPVEGAGPAHEGYMLIGAGIPTLPGFGPTGGSAHAPDEWVDLASLPVTVAFFAGIIQEVLTG